MSKVEYTTPDAWLGDLRRRAKGSTSSTADPSLTPQHHRRWCPMQTRGQRVNPALLPSPGQQSRVDAGHRRREE
jgi:hypothetical protein